MQASLRKSLPSFSQINWLTQTGSTNADLMQQARHNLGTMLRPWLLGTHLQSQGRGRSGRTWQNRAGANLMFSCAFDVFLPARQLATITPLIGIATCQALRALISPENQHRFKLKWPNDILWDNAKLAGILIESTRSGTSKSADHHLIIIGLGMNLTDANALASSLDRKIADWQQIRQQDTTIAQSMAPDIVCQIAMSWYKSLNQVSAYGFNDLPTEYAQYDALAGQTVNVIDNDQILFSGLASGIDTEGHLLVQTDTTTQAVSVGEISIRAAV